MKSKRLLMTAAAAFVLAVAPSYAQDQTAPSETAARPSTEASEAAAKTPQDITLELNKLEPSSKGCRAYLVVSNSGDTTFDTYNLELFVFHTDGVIGNHFSLNVAPLRPAKRTVKIFDLKGAKCEDIGSFFVNDVLECHAEAGAVDNCLARLKLNTLSKVELSK